MLRSSSLVGLFTANDASLRLVNGCSIHSISCIKNDTNVIILSGKIDPLINRMQVAINVILPVGLRTERKQVVHTIRDIYSRQYKRTGTLH